MSNRTPTSILSSFQETAKFNFVWRINLVFTIVGFVMMIFTYLIQDRFFKYYVLVFVLTIGSLFFLKYLKTYKLVAKILYLVVSTVLGAAIFSVPESLHLQESLWMVVLILAAFFTLGNVWGCFYLLVNTIFYGIYYNYQFAGTAHISLTIRPDALFLLSIEFAVSMFLIGYVMFQYGLINKYAFKHASKAYENLNSEKQIVELQNREKTVLLQEIHHRVKNNMQVIVSLLRMQSREIISKEGKESFEDAITRIMTMSLIHQKMYEKESLIDLDVKDYLSTLINNLVKSNAVNKDISFTVNSSLKCVSAKNMVPLGLIINELVSNSIKHAFESIGRIELTLTPLEGTSFSLSYFDDGTWKENDKQTFGTQLIEVFTDQLDGTYEREIIDSGTYFHFTLIDDVGGENKL
ncbi:sensor histidine kinase [Brumimicrobium mesophilum]|uniref:sensor histidine kinase n=1 Tax=Brumimicrobium mesophilum TaxID=392717 RepID=UPI000D142CAF|nr:histidine kinase dimerization/phosphoacceptor domain -containing protein [Brumimicrobium mesophilum]